MHTFSSEEMAIINQANRILKSKIRKGPIFTDPATVAMFLQTELAHKEHEEFFVLFLNTKHRLIKCETMFRGTIDSSAVYPREVVKRALEVEAAAVLFAHNHPSDDVQPSMADRAITLRLKDALALVDIKVLDHFVVGKDETYSFAAKGLI